MKIVVINGSHRGKGGNTDTMVTALLIRSKGTVLLLPILYMP